MQYMDNIQVYIVPNLSLDFLLLCIFRPNAVGNDIWVWEDTLFGDYYMIASTNEGVAFVRVTDPDIPETLATLLSQ